MARKAMTKKTRFDVFKRDSFTCQYCGGTPPAVILEVDHIDPVSNGGTDDGDNLVTACFDCNRGKAAGLLTAIPETVKDKMAKIVEKELQVKEYNKVLAKKRKREESDIDRVEDTFRFIYEDRMFTDHFRNSIRKNFLPYLPITTLEDAMAKAVNVTKDSSSATKYFCGICWNLRKHGGEI